MAVRDDHSHPSNGSSFLFGLSFRMVFRRKKGKQNLWF
jgi:hypothetical protein